MIAVLAGFAFISYKHFAWELTESELHIYEGFVFKKEAHIPFRRVHSIDYSAKVVERALGVVTLRIETAGGGQKAEAEIAALRLSEAEALRYEVFARKSRLESGAVGACGRWGRPRRHGYRRRARPPLGVRARSIRRRVRGRLAGRVRAPAHPQGAHHRRRLQQQRLPARVRRFGGLSQILSIIGGSDGAIIDYAQGAAAYLLSFGIIVAAVVATFALLFAWTISIAATAVSYGGFTVRRRGGRVEIERGLLEHRVTGVAIDRIQSVRIKQGALRRLIGFAEVSLETVASPRAADAANGGETGLVVHPLIRHSETRAFIAEMLPEFSAAPGELAPLPPRATEQSDLSQHGLAAARTGADRRGLHALRPAADSASRHGLRRSRPWCSSSRVRGSAT